MISALEKRLSTQLAKQKSSGRYRVLENNNTAQGRVVNIDGKHLINFCSNDYLGLCSDSRLKEASVSTTREYGVGAGAAALLSGRHEIHERLERKLASFTGYESALIFSSGYLANLGLISAIVSRRDEVHHDKLNHASLIDAVKLSGARHKRFPHADVNTLAQNLAASSSQNWVVTDGIFSMDGDLAPLNQIAPIAKHHNATLIVDDAHGFGVLHNGMGTVAHCGLLPEDVPIQIITFGKALGAAGAAVLGSKTLIEHLIQSCRTFIYDTALPPAIASAALAAVELLASDTKLISTLNTNIAHFRKLCLEQAIPISKSTTPIQPIILGEEARALTAAKILRDNGIYVRAVRPPTVPVGTSRLRVCLSASHTFSDIEKLVDLLRTITQCDGVASVTCTTRNPIST